MLSQLLTVVALTTGAMAAPSVITLRSDDVVLYGKGRYQIIKRTELDEIEALRKNGTVPPMPGYLDSNLITISGPNANNSSQTENRPVQKREDSTIIVPGPDSRFLGWDTQMSQVLKG